MEIKMVKVEDLKPYVNNPRLNDDAVEYVANSIKQFGFKVPMVIDKDNVIVAGHTRFKASLELGLKEVPCIIADDLNEEQIKAFRLADNKVSEKADWNIELLDEELNDLDIDMSEFGFSSYEETFDENDLDDERQKEKFNVSIIFDKQEEYEIAKKELEIIADKYNGNISYKMI